MVVRLLPSIHLLDAGNFHKSSQSFFLLGRGAETLMQINSERRRF